MNKMIGFVKHLFCFHRFKFIRNIYGDQIIEYGWKRSVWSCYTCKKVKLGDYFYE